jgi:hypothetical protein
MNDNKSPRFKDPTVLNDIFKNSKEAQAFIGGGFHATPTEKTHEGNKIYSIRIFNPQTNEDIITREQTAKDMINWFDGQLLPEYRAELRGKVAANNRERTRIQEKLEKNPELLKGVLKGDIPKDNLDLLLGAGEESGAILEQILAEASETRKADEAEETKKRNREQQLHKMKMAKAKREAASGERDVIKDVNDILNGKSFEEATDSEKVAINAILKGSNRLRIETEDVPAQRSGLFDIGKPNIPATTRETLGVVPRTEEGQSKQTGLAPQEAPIIRTDPKTGRKVYEIKGKYFEDSEGKVRAKKTAPTSALRTDKIKTITPEDPELKALKQKIGKYKNIGNTPEEKKAQKELARREIKAFLNKTGLSKEDWKATAELYKDIFGWALTGWSWWKRRVGSALETQRKTRESLGR